LKDLETKVDDLQKASESANHENSILRAQIEKMSTELKEYKKKISVGSAGAARSSSLNSKLPAYLSGQGLGGAVSTPNDVNFSFDFPRFGRLPGVSPAGVNGILNGARQSTSPGSTSVSPIDRDQISPRNQSQQFAPPVSTVGSIGVTRPSAMHDGGDMSSLSGLFSPSILESVGKSPEYDFFGNRANTNGSRSSGDGNMSTGHNTSYSSPSASSNSNNGPTSSCGTSPEPTLQSPVMNKPVDSALTTIGEERSGETNTEGELTFCDKLNMACGNSKNPVPRTMSETSTTSGFQPQEAQTPAFDVNGIDWFAQQNDNQFDPQLFNDYREPQDNILSTDAFGDSFFSDAFAIPDFNTPYNIEASPVPPKKDLVQQIDEQQNADDEVVPAEDTSKMLSCNTIWYVFSIQSGVKCPANQNFRDRLQACPKVKDGDFDLDNLCKDLQKKAKCSETGAVVDESDFQKIMQTYADNNSKQTTY
jgi:AP-1-like factor